jgi:predicted Zn-dependent peptidase
MKKMISIFCSCLAVVQITFGQVEPEVFTLDNGMKFILLPRFEEPNNVAAGWVAKVGSVNERPGITGISHFFEHLMFKGTNTIGTSNAAVDAEFTEKERSIRNMMLDIIWGEQYDRFKLGEIDDPWSDKNDTPQLASLRAELKRVMEDHRSVIVKDEFASIYQSAGAVGLNAFTSEDVTFYINMLPANKLELWCWMESDRLSNSVFREFYSERDVVHEERRMRTEASPTGEFDEQFNSLFWQASSYSWPVIGWPSDLNSYTLEGAQRYFDVYYRPNNLVGVLVGDFDVDEARSMIELYFGPLERGETPPPPVPTIEPSQKAPQRMAGEVEAQSQVEIRYHAVPFGHKDGYSLEIMAGVLNGRTGRLYKSMVEGDEIASTASVSYEPKKYAGLFAFYASVKGDTTGESLESAWLHQLSLLQSEPVTEYELEKVKNSVIADQYRGLQSNFYLMIQLGYMEAIGGWEFINTAKDSLLAVTADDIMRVANEYLIPNNSSIAMYTRAKGAAPINEELAAFGPQEQQMIKQALLELESLPEDEMFEALTQMKTQATQVPPEFKPVFDYLLKRLQENLDRFTSEETTTTEVPEAEAAEEEITEQPQVLVLTPQQQAQADEMLDVFADKRLGELIQVYGVMQMAATSVSPEDRPVFEFVLAKLAVYIAELEK